MYAAHRAALRKNCDCSQWSRSLRSAINVRSAHELQPQLRLAAYVSRHSPHSLQRLVCKVETLLFICSRNKLRSPTAETIFQSLPEYYALSAGTDPHCPNPVEPDIIESADRIFCMEDHHRKFLNTRFPELFRRKKTYVLRIPDNYSYMQPELIEILLKRTGEILGKNLANGA